MRPVPRDGETVGPTVLLQNGGLYSSVVEHQSCKLKVLGSIPSGGCSFRASFCPPGRGGGGNSQSKKTIPLAVSAAVAASRRPALAPVLWDSERGGSKPRATFVLVLVLVPVSVLVLALAPTPERALRWRQRLVRALTAKHMPVSWIRPRASLQLIYATLRPRPIVLVMRRARALALITGRRRGLSPSRMQARPRRLITTCEL